MFSAKNSWFMRTLSGTSIKFLLLLYVIATSMTFCASHAWSGQEYVPGEIIIKFKPSKFTNEKASVLNGNPVKPLFQKPNQGYFRAVSSSNGLTNIYLVKVQEGTEIENSEVYAKMPDVVYAEPNYIHHICVSPNDPATFNNGVCPKFNLKRPGA